MKRKVTREMAVAGSALFMAILCACPLPVKAETENAASSAAAVEDLLSDINWDTMAAADVSSYVNIRREATKESDIVGVLSDGRAVNAISTDDGWTKISSGDIEGYIKSEYLVFGDEAKETYLSDTGILGTVTADSLTVRSDASEGAEKLSSKEKGSLVRIEGVEDGWYEIAYNGEADAYVAAEYIEVEELQGAQSLEEYKEARETAAEVYCTAGELDMLAAIIQCEAGGESRTGKVAVGAVVLNRVRSGKFPNNIEDVIKQKGQFTPVRSGKFGRTLSAGAREDCYEAARAALAGENPVGDALFFSAGKGRGMQIGNQHFY